MKNVSPTLLLYLQMYFAFHEQFLFVESKTQNLYKYSVSIAHVFMASFFFFFLNLHVQIDIQKC